MKFTNLLQYKFLIAILFLFSSCEVIQSIFGGASTSGNHVAQQPIDSYSSLPASCRFNSLDSFDWPAGTTGSNIENILNAKLQDPTCNLNANSNCVPPTSPTTYNANSENYDSEIKCTGNFNPCKLWYDTGSGTIILTGDDMNTILNNAFANAHTSDRLYCSCQSMKARIKNQEISAQNVNGNRTIYVKTLFTCCGKCR